MVDVPVREGLRERKKRLTRDTLVGNALRLFEERGFDGVTTAEIADVSNVAVKTLFVYFPTKEDLVFADEEATLAELCGRLRARPTGTSPLAALRAMAHEKLDGQCGDPLESLGAFARVLGENATLHSRLQMMWEHYEQGIAEVLAHERATVPHDPVVRVTAALLIAPFRALTSQDIRAREDVAADVGGWLDSCFDVVALGLGE